MTGSNRINYRFPPKDQVAVGAAYAEQWHRGALALRDLLAPYDSTPLRDPYPADIRVAAQLNAIENIVVRAVLNDVTIADWSLTANQRRFDIQPSAFQPSPAALRVAGFRALFTWRDSANWEALRPLLRGTYTNNDTPELARLHGEVVVLPDPKTKQPGVVLSGKNTYTINAFTMRKLRLRPGDRVSFVARVFRGHLVAHDVKVLVGQARKAA